MSAFDAKRTLYHYVVLALRLWIAGTLLLERRLLALGFASGAAVAQHRERQRKVERLRSTDGGPSTEPQY